MEVLYQVNNHIAEITLNRAQKRNAFNETLALQLNHSLCQANQDEAVRVILLSGAGKSFCAGGDIEEFAQMSQLSTVEIEAKGKVQRDLFETAFQLRKPMIGAIHGHALGGGFGLAAACHIVLATPETKFGATEINLGLFPFVITPHLIHMLGYRQALELSLTGRILTTDEAQQIGLVHHQISQETLLECAKHHAGSIAAKSPTAIQIGMQAFAAARTNVDSTTYDVMNGLRTLVLKSDDLQEGTRAFLDKRAPVWRGK